MFLIIFKVLYDACCNGNNKGIARTWAHNEQWVTLMAYNMMIRRLILLTLLTLHPDIGMIFET